MNTSTAQRNRTGASCRSRGFVSSIRVSLTKRIRGIQWIEDQENLVAPVN